MPLTRRHFLQAAAAAATSPLFAHRSLANVPLGAGTLTTVSDGHLTLPADFIFAPMPKDALAPILDQYGIADGPLTPECNLALYRDGTNTVLFDIGSGPDFMPTAGTLLEGMETAGISPEDVTHVVFTHAHPDHIWGLLDDFDEPLLPEATYMMGRAEWDYWWNPETVNTIGDARAAFAVGAKRRLEALESMVEFFDPGQEILPGIASIASHGHTPGHMSFELRNGSDSALVIGDAIGNHHVAFARPDWESGSDQDGPLAAQTRMQLLDRLANEKMRAVGFHLPGGGLGRVELAGDAYRFVQEDA
ncbi:MBL fold metallo-hydrolase [Aliishimia ponticola]|uniref:MBL fold metallo-hydrolase n=1 Tax=Aliishimia ponticola TaxID=2499833 RepID=A0A4S4NER6_9RHOB|nr:MBL fold metallo-hydrolase [Aliishimia ponticola]THH38036.1 MBL fold metallo-hydrolase [Aliishimia ponticola]